MKNYRQLLRSSLLGNNERVVSHNNYGIGENHQNKSRAIRKNRNFRNGYHGI